MTSIYTGSILGLEPPPDEPPWDVYYTGDDFFEEPDRIERDE